MFIGENLKKQRLLKGYSPEQLSTKSGVPKDKICALENCLRRGTPNTWLKLAKALDISVEELIKANPDFFV